MRHEKILTRKECILIAEQFVRSGFKGLSVSKIETTANVKSSLGNLVASAITSEDLASMSEQEQFRARDATRQELRDADKLTAVMLISGLNKIQAKILYLRAFHVMPWKVIALKFNTDWAHARRMYDDSLHLIYHKAKLWEKH